MCSIIGYLGHRFTPESISPYFDRTLSRGPDMSRVLPIPGGFLGFHRLAIMGLTEMGMQPFVRGDMALVCNGEIYGFRAIRKTLQEKGYLFHSGSDCEILLPLYAEHMASPASTALVEEHLQECEACRAELEQMQLPVPVQPEPQPDAPLKGIRASLRKKRILTAAAAVLAVLCAVALVFWMGTLSTPVTAEEAGIWLYNKKEDGANLCVLEVQGENVRLETEGGFSWGKEYITVRAMRYTFPGLHAALTKLTGSEIVSTEIAVSRTQVLAVECADETRYYSDSQQVERFIAGENPDGTVRYGYGTEEQYGHDFKKG